MSVENLIKNQEALERQLFWLTHSFDLCNKAGIKESYQINEFDAFETLCSRFSRSIDFLVRKVFRSIDAVEFENQGTLIDTVNNAHKRGLFNDIETLRTIKEIRNEIAHEYVDEGLKDTFADVLEYTPVLIKMMKTTYQYCNKYKL